MTDQKRDPHAGNDLIDDDLPTPSQGGTSGGRIEREIGAADEEKVATGADPQPTSVHKSQKPDGGDAPNLPNPPTPRDRIRLPPSAPADPLLPTPVEPRPPFADSPSCALSSRP